eukprot:GGOE01049294.1.p1 GENE.GGOE01049294.1~~GGOE01049294.1.p1  ORF type:complete len:169 (+),score=34.96 GGOE01049294.1:50-556(+)
MPTKTVDGCVYVIEPAAPPAHCCYDSEDEDRDQKHKRRRTTMPLVLREEDGIEVLAAMKTEVVVHKQVMADAGKVKAAAVTPSSRDTAFESEEADNVDEALPPSRVTLSAPVSAGTASPAAARLNSQQFSIALLRSTLNAKSAPPRAAQSTTGGRNPAAARSGVRQTA